MSYSRRARTDAAMSRKAQEDLALHNWEAKVSISAIADMLALSPEKTKEFISNAKIRRAERESRGTVSRFRKSS